MKKNIGLYWKSIFSAFSVFDSVQWNGFDNRYNMEYCIDGFGQFFAQFKYPVCPCWCYNSPVCARFHQVHSIHRYTRCRNDFPKWKRWKNWFVGFSDEHFLLKKLCLLWITFGFYRTIWRNLWNTESILNSLNHIWWTE